MTRDEVLLAAMATSPEHTYSPVQLQKVLLLLDRRGPKQLSGHFDFKPYHYAPFDRSIYDDLEQLETQGRVEIVREPHLKLRKYRLSEAGAEAGKHAIEK